MKRFLCAAFAVASLLLSFSNARAQAPTDTLRTYIFGHSLINHALQVNPTPSQETSVPHWFQLLAVEAGHGYAVSGQYGFLNGHATGLPPSAQWGFDTVPGAWEEDFETFAEADFDNVLFTPANFVQYQPAHVNYYMDTLSPLTASNMILNWCAAQEDSMEYYLYENWPDMAGYLSNGFPPTASEWNQYNAYTQGGFHDWFLDFHDSLRVAHPDKCVRMIPVGTVISRLLAQSPYNTIAVDTLYEDDAPHGRPTIYFLAALATYMAMYEEPAPVTYQVPAIIAPEIASNYPAVVSFIWNELLAFNDSLGNNRVFCNSPLTSTVPAVEAEVVVYPNPTTGRVHLELEAGDWTVEVLDLTGKVVWHGTSGQVVDLGHVQDGMYLVRVRDAQNGAQLVRRLVKHSQALD